MNREDNEIYQNALRKIDWDKKCCNNFVIVGPTGPTVPITLSTHI